MSLDLDWSLLDDHLADSLLAKLNASLSKAPRPDFIGPITLTSLDFGQDAPEVTLTHLGDVWRELSDESAAAASAAAAAAAASGVQHPHASTSSGGAAAAVAVRHVASQSSQGYDDEYEEDEEGDVIAPGEQGYRANGGGRRAPLRKPLRPGDHLARLAEHSLPFTGPGVVGPRLQTFRQYTPSDIQQVHGGAAGSSLASFPASIPHWAHGGGGGGGSGSVSGSGLATPAWGAGLGTRPWPQRSQTSGAAGVVASPYHSGVPTPTTSGYFSHWPSSQQHFQHQQQQQQQYRRPTYWRASNSGLSASRSTPAWGASPGTESGTPDRPKDVADPSSSSQALPSVQCHFSVVWSTNTLKLGINTSLVINQPTPAFMQLPLSVAVIGLGVQAGVVVAFEEGDDARGTGRRVHVSLVEDESGIGLGEEDEEGEEEESEEQDGAKPHRREDTNDTILASGQATTTMAAAIASKTRGHISPPQYGGSRRTSGSQANPHHAPPLPPHQQRPPTVGERLLPHITLESSVGQADKHVLRNVGKVEKFIAEVLRKAVEDELVWPNFYSVGLPAPQDQDQAQQQGTGSKKAGGRRQSDVAETMSHGSL